MPRAFAGLRFHSLLSMNRISSGWHLDLFIASLKNSFDGFLTPMSHETKTRLNFLASFLFIRASFDTCHWSERIIILYPALFSLNARL